MSRAIPKNVVVPKLHVMARSSSIGDRHQVVSDFKLITPMFGGGVEPREHDPLTPVRGTAIRGHLRFWWRATIGSRFATSEELASEEAKIWGDMNHKSAVVVCAHVIDFGKRTPCATFPPGKKYPNFINGWPAYALFPFQGDPATGAAYATSDLRFKLTLSYPVHLEKDVETALRTWTLFGGLGARTRRGCGALSCNQFNPKTSKDVAVWLTQSQFPLREWPTVPSHLQARPAEMDSLQAWGDGIASLREFRQGVEIGRNRGHTSTRPGRSRWPEPEAIRRATKKRGTKYQRLTDIPDTHYPRAELGLPIIFHFNDCSDPPDTELLPFYKGKVSDRFASPLILKPLALADASFCPILLKLKSPPPDRVELRSCTSKQRIEEASVRDGSLARDHASPLFERSESGSALEAFLKFAETKGFSVIQP
jgi:CRISPR-associated protein Cmr1